MAFDQLENRSQDRNYVNQKKRVNARTMIDLDNSSFVNIKQLYLSILLDPRSSEAFSDSSRGETTISLLIPMLRRKHVRHCKPF